MNPRRWIIAMTLVLLAYGPLCLWWWNNLHRPYPKYPDWTPKQQKIINKVIDRKTTITRIGIHEAYFIRDGQKWRLRL